MLDPKDLYITGYRDPAHGNCVWLPMNGITILHIPTQIGVTVNSERSQHKNKAKALGLLEKLVDDILQQSEEDDGPLTHAQYEAIRAASPATDTPEELFTQRLF